MVPTVTELSRPFWDGCAAGELRLQVCLACGHVRYPIAEGCPRCWSRDFEWRRMSGDGEILSWVVFHRAYRPAWAPRVPYNLVLVQLAEGPRMFSNVEPLHLGAHDLSVGAAVRVVFVAEPGFTVPRWELVQAGTAAALA